MSVIFKITCPSCGRVFHPTNRDSDRTDIIGVCEMTYDFNSPHPKEVVLVMSDGSKVVYEMRGALDNENK